MRRRIRLERGTLSRRQWRLLVRLALATAVALLIIARYTSPRSLFQTTSPAGTEAPRR